MILHIIVAKNMKKSMVTNNKKSFIELQKGLGGYN